MITKEQVEHIAHLARLTLSPKEKEHLPKELSQIVDYFAQISELNLEDIQPTSHAVDVENVFRENEDEVVQTEIIEKVIEAAPEKDNHFFIVPKVL